MRPLIGITTLGRIEQPLVTGNSDSHFAVPTQFVDAVRRAGGLAVLLPPGETDDPAGLLDRVDGVIVTGGTDLDPGLYGGDRAHPKLGVLDAERDQGEMALTRRLLERADLPALFVCRGLQLLNVVCGGTLYEHIADVHPENIHEGPDAGWTEHEVALSPGSRVAAITGAGTLRVASGNHQGIKALGDGLLATAHAADGVIVAVEHQRHPFCLGVQWHPELRAAPGNAHQAMFDALVTAARTRRD